MEYNVFQNNKILDYLKVKEGWNLYKFSDLLIDDTKNATKIKKEDYIEEGTYPIVDQGKLYIAGFKNESKGLYNSCPCIIFGDHTRILKYIDFPLYIGADGVKLLKPLLEESRLNVRYLYYFLNTVDLPNDGYSRHFKYLKQVVIPLPDIDVQNKIVIILDKAHELIEKRKKQIEQLDELVKSRFMEMFGYIKDYVTVSEYIESLTAGKSLAGESECQNKVLNTGSVSYDYYDETQAKNLPLDYLPKDEHLVNKGDVLISRMNTAELVGATAYVWKSNDHIYIPDRLWKANFKSNVNPVFVWQLLIQRSTKEKIRRIASGTSGSMKNVSKSGLLGIEVIKVDIDKQNEFATFVKQVDKLKFEMENSLKELEDNFNSLMQKAFKGELF